MYPDKSRNSERGGSVLYLGVIAEKAGLRKAKSGFFPLHESPDIPVQSGATGINGLILSGNTE